MTQGSKYSDTFKAAVIAEFANGEELPHLAAKHGIHVSTLGRWLGRVDPSSLTVRGESPNVLEGGHWVSDGLIQRWVS